MLFGRTAVAGTELLIFVHVPKTAGSAIKLAVREIVGEDRSFSPGKGAPKVAELDLARRESIRFLAGHFDYGQHIHFFAHPLYVTVVRDPIDRFVSWYKFVVKGRNHRWHSTIAGMTIDEAALYAIEYGLDAKNLSQCQSVCRSPCFEIARAFIDRNYFLACSIDQVDEWFEALCLAYAPTCPFRPLPRVNVSKSSGIGPSDAVRRTMEGAWSDDFRLYRYVRAQFEDVARHILPAVREHGYAGHLARTSSAPSTDLLRA